MRALRVVAIAFCILPVFTLTSAALAADPETATLDPTATQTAWAGMTFLQAQSPRGTCDPTGNACDVLTLTVDVDPTYWDTHDGRVVVGIEWLDAGDDLDLFSLAPDGTVVSSSASSTGTSEHLALEEPSGRFEIQVAAVSVQDSGYEGWAAFETQEVAPDDVGSETGPTGTTAPAAETGPTTDPAAETGPTTAPAAETGPTGATGYPAAGPGSSDGPAGGHDADGSGPSPASTSVGHRSSLATAAPTHMFGFARPPFDARTFDSRAPSTRAAALDGSVPSDATSAGLVAEPVVLSSQPVPLRVAPSGSSVGHPPESAWVALALGVLALSLTAIAVDEPDPGRGQGPARRRADRVRR